MDKCIVKNGKVNACDSLRNELREELDECLEEGMFNYCKWCGTDLTEDSVVGKLKEITSKRIPIGDFPEVEIINNIDFIKWLCDKAEGFKVGSIIYDAIQMTVIVNKKKVMVGSNSWKSVYYPLLLHRSLRSVLNNLALNMNAEEWTKSLEAFMDDEKTEKFLKKIYQQEKDNGSK